MLVGAAAATPMPALSQEWPSPHVTNTDEAKVGSYVLPDPLISARGAPVKTARQWPSRRQEILALAQDNQFGRTPTTALRTRFEVWERDAVGLGGQSRRSQIRIRFSDDPGAPVLHVLLHVPAHASRPPPVVLSLSFEPNVMTRGEPGVEEGAGWDLRTHQKVAGSKATPIGHVDIAALVRRGYAVASIYYGDIEPDFDGGVAFGVRPLLAGAAPRGPHDWGAIGAWAWGASRVLDYLLTDPEVDGRRTAILGASRLGKAALWAGAQDERFAMVIPVISGEGGAALSRRDFGETIGDLVAPGRYAYWFAPRYKDFAADPRTSPLDSHMLLALVAPRPLLLVNGSSDTWSDPTGEWLAAQAATPVYRLLGRKGVPAQRPAIGELAGKDLAVVTHDGGHTLLARDLDLIADVMDAELRAGRK
jgi:hypothetical protein